LFASCLQNPRQEASIPNSPVEEGSSNNIIITDSNYTLTINGVKDTLESVAQISNALEKAKNNTGEDTIYIYMKSTIAERMQDISTMLRNLNITKNKYVVTENYFALPYPKHTEETEKDK
jgi:hypothetical protein